MSVWFENVAFLFVPLPERLSTAFLSLQWSTFDELNKLQHLEEIHIHHITKLGEKEFVRGIVIAKLAKLTLYNRTKVSGIALYYQYASKLW